MGPAAEEVLEPQHRLILWRATYRYFFRCVWVFVVIQIHRGHTGYYDYFLDSEGSLIPHLIRMHLMHTIGLIMVGIFCYLYFALYRPFCRLIALGLHRSTVITQPQPQSF